MLFSVLCLTYNHAGFIEECIASIVRQTYSDWEMIILNDGSTDATEKVIRPWLTDSRISYHYQENLGPEKLAVSYNRLLELARGEIVTILEGDDYCSPELLQRHRAAFEDAAVVLSFAQVEVVEKWGTWISPQRPKSAEEAAILNNTPPGRAYNRLLKECFIPAQGTSIRRDGLKKIGGFVTGPGLPTVDYPTWLKLATIGVFRFIPQPLATWRRHIGQMTRQAIVPLTKAMLPVFFSTLSTLPPEVAREVKLTRTDLEKYWNRQLAIVLIRGGRYKLMIRDWRTARRYFSESFRNWPAILLTWRIKACLGIIFTYLHLNLEWLAAFSKLKLKIINGRHQCSS